MKYHLDHLPEVKAAIAAAADCATIDELQAAIRAFDANPLCLTPAMPGGPGERCASPNPVMILGKAPAGTETETRVPFSGPAGRVLREQMALAGFDIEACWITCATPWRARKDNTPNATQIALSRPFLYREIEIVAPSVIIALGDKATEALFQSHAYSVEAAGTEMTLEIGETKTPVVVMLNHAYVMYNPPERAHVFRRHLAEAARRHPDAFDRIACNHGMAA